VCVMNLIDGDCNNPVLSIKLSLYLHKNKTSTVFTLTKNSNSTKHTRVESFVLKK
jgi:hypothetical protein